MPEDTKKYQQRRTGKRGAVKTAQESHWEGPKEMPTGEGRPGHFSKDVEPED